MTERQPVSENYLKMKREEIVFQLTTSALVVQHHKEHPETLPPEMVKHHMLQIKGCLDMGRLFGFKPSELCNEASNFIKPPKPPAKPTPDTDLVHKYPPWGKLNHTSRRLQPNEK